MALHVMVSYAAEAVTVHQGRNGPSDMHEPYIEYLSMFSQETLYPILITGEGRSEFFDNTSCEGGNF